MLGPGARSEVGCGPLRVAVILALLAGIAGPAHALSIAVDPSMPTAGTRVQVAVDQANATLLMTEVPPERGMDAFTAVAGNGTHFIRARWGVSHLFVPHEGDVQAKDANGTMAPVVRLPAPGPGWHEFVIVFTNPGNWTVTTGQDILEVNVAVGTESGFPYYETETGGTRAILAQIDPRVATTPGPLHRFLLVAQDGDAWMPVADADVHGEGRCIRICPADARVDLPTRGASNRGIHEGPFLAAPGRWELTMNFTLTRATAEEEGVVWAVDVQGPATSNQTVEDGGHDGRRRLAFDAMREGVLLVHALDPDGPGWAIAPVHIGRPLPFVVDVRAPDRVAPGAEVILEARVRARDPTETRDPGTVRFDLWSDDDRHREAYAIPFGEGLYRARWVAEAGNWTIQAALPDAGMPGGSIASRPLVVAVATRGTGEDSLPENPTEVPPDPTETPVPPLLALGALISLPLLRRLYA